MNFFLKFKRIFHWITLISYWIFTLLIWKQLKKIFLAQILPLNIIFKQRILLIFRVLFFVTINCFIYIYLRSQHLFNSISRSSVERYENNEKQKKKKKGKGRNKTTYNAQTQAILFLSTLRKRYCSTRTTRLERSEVFQIDRNLIPFEQNFHSITVSLATL